MDDQTTITWSILILAIISIIMGINWIIEKITNWKGVSSLFNMKITQQPFDQKLVTVEKETNKEVTHTPAIIENLHIPNWWNNIMGEFTHLMVVGSTGAGKTTFCRALLRTLNGYGKLIVIDPHIKWHWTPMPTIGWGNNFQDIEKAMLLILAEMKKRYEFANESAENEEKLEHLYVIIDEYPAVQAALPDISKQFFQEISMQARKSKIHLIVITQSRLVEALGIKGNSALRDNFITIYLGLEAMQMAEADYSAAIKAGNSVEFPCVIQLGTKTFPVRRDFILPLSNKIFTPNVYPLPIASLQKQLEEIKTEPNKEETISIPELKISSNLEEHLKVMVEIFNTKLTTKTVARRIFGQVDEKTLLHTKEIMWNIYLSTGKCLEELQSEFSNKEDLLNN